MTGNSNRGWPHSLADILANSPDRPGGLAAPYPNALTDPLLMALAGVFPSDNARRRAEWNDRFLHWERPASVSEAGTIERADTLVSEVVAANSWLTGQGVAVRRQGSYHNNSNVRTEADIDLRVVHPSVKVEYAANVIDPAGWDRIAYRPASLTLEQIFTGLRAHLVTNFRRRFGENNVVVGNKAIRIKGVTGSRAEIDVVPAVPLHFVRWNDGLSNFQTLEGVAILGRDGGWTGNFPEQHAANGIGKRARTAHRFKKVVRIFKRMRADMTDRGLLRVKVPSFLVECLVHAVEDSYFLVDSDDRYDRVRRVALRMQAILLHRPTAANLHEINNLKWLFHDNQAWTYDDACTFVNAVVVHLGDV
jgi:hypothetical protein